MSTNADKMREAFEEFLKSDVFRLSGSVSFDCWNAFQAGAKWLAPDPQRWQTVMEAAHHRSSIMNEDCYNSDEATSLRAALRYFDERGME